MLYSSNSASLLLGGLCCNPSLLLSGDYRLDKRDFEGSEEAEFHKIIFVSIYCLLKNGVTNIDEISINEFLESYKAKQAIFEKNDGINFIPYVKELSVSGTMPYYYEKVKKFSLLRAYKQSGFDISEIFDETKNEDTEMEKFEDYSLKEIIDYFELKQLKIKADFYIDDSEEEMICGDEFDEILEGYEEDPMLGGSSPSLYTNSLYRGWLRGHLNLTGAGSGIGKTLTAISELVMVSCSSLYSTELNQFIENKCYCGKGAYIHTEQKMRHEIQPRFISNIANVEYNKILDGKCSQEEKDRCKVAGEIVKNGSLKLINMPNFTATKLKQKIRQLALEGYEYIVFDYIWNNYHIMSDLKQEMGMQSVSEPQALLHMVNVLKTEAERNNVGIKTMMQLNDSYKTSVILDEGALYGSKGVKTKLDNGNILAEPREKELALATPLIVEWNKQQGYEPQNYIIPNIISHCFKTRYGRYGINLKIWGVLDRGLGKMNDMFVTTWDNNYVDVPKLKIEREKK